LRERGKEAVKLERGGGGSERKQVRKIEKQPITKLVRRVSAGEGGKSNRKKTANAQPGNKLGQGI